MPYENREVLSFENGLEEYLEPSRLAEGFATELYNWIPEPDGSLRARQKWQPMYHAAGAPNPRQVRGLIYMQNYQPTAGNFDPAWIFANQMDADTYRLYGIRHSLKDVGPITQIDQFDSPDASLNVPMAYGLGHLFFTNFEMARIRKWTGVVGAAAAEIPNSPSGRALLVYKNRLFSFGNESEYWKLFFTALNDEDDWTGTSAGEIEVGSDDGDAGHAMTALENGILLGKENSLWYLLGTNPNNFQLVQLNSGDAAPGSSIVNTPAGAVIAGRREVYVFAGGQPQPISRPIGLSYSVAEDDFVTAAYVDGKVYIVPCDAEEIFVYDLVQKSWTKEDYEDTSGRPCVLASFKEYLVGGAANDVDSPLGYYRQANTGERAVDTVGTTYRAKTPELWLGGPEKPFTMKHVYVKLRQRAGDQSQAPLKMRYLNEGIEMFVEDLHPTDDPGVYSYDFSASGTGYFCQFEVTHTVPAGQEACFDLEEIELVFDAEKGRTGRGGGPT